MAGILKVDQVQSDSNLAFAIAGSNVAFMNATSLQMVGSNVSLAGTNVITNGKLVTAAQPIGAVLQVAQARKTDSSFSVASTSLTDITGLSVTMTPTSSSSKFLVYVDLFVGTYWWSTNGGKLGVTCNGTLIAGNSTDFWALQYGADSGNSGYEVVQWTDSVLYSPATSSSLTFNAQVAAGNGSYAMYINRSYNGTYAMGGRSVLTVMEIAG